MLLGVSRSTLWSATGDRVKDQPHSATPGDVRVAPWHRRRISTFVGWTRALCFPLDVLVRDRRPRQRPTPRRQATSALPLGIDAEAQPSWAGPERRAGNTERFNVRFSASRDLKEKLLRLGEVLGVSDPTGNLDKIVEAALEIALDKKDPQRRNERRRERATKSAEMNPSPPAEMTTTNEPTSEPSPPAKTSRYIPLPVRDAVLARADFQCEYRHQGRRCSCRTGLQVDHIQPHARGGPNDIQNLRALCPSHNLWFAERHFGRRFIRAKIDAARSVSLTN